MPWTDLKNAPAVSAIVGIGEALRRVVDALVAPGIVARHHREVTFHESLRPGDRFVLRVRRPPLPLPARRMCRRSPPCRATILGGAKRAPYLPSSRAAKFDEFLRAHEIDVAQGAARVRREAETEDRAHIGLARIGDDALLDGARRFERLGRRGGAASAPRMSRVSPSRCRCLQSREVPARGASGRSPDSRRSPSGSCVRGVLPSRRCGRAALPARARSRPRRAAPSWPSGS